MSLPMCTDVEASAPIRNPHRPMSVPMLQHTRPLENLTSADVGTDVAGCFASPSEISHRPMSVPMLQDARSSPSRFHIGRCRYRCCKMPGRAVEDFTSADVGTDVCQLYQSPRIGTSADVGADVSCSTGGGGHGRPMSADVGRCRLMSADVGQCRPVSAHVGRCRSMSAHVGPCRQGVDGSR